MVNQYSLRIGFIGIGLMGAPMVRRLLAAGFPVTVWNRNISKCQALPEYGAEVADSIANLVETVDVVMLCLSDTAAVEDVVFGENAVADHGRDGQILVDFSSIDSVRTADFAARLKDCCGMDWVDAPVSGGTGGAEDGTLIIMAGGEPSVVERVKFVFEPLARKLTHMGPVGAGQIVKVCNQMIVACNALVVAEMLAMARRAKVNVSRLPEVLAGGFADSIPLQILIPQMAEHDFTLKWKVATLLKDLEGAVDLSGIYQSAVPITDIACQLLRGHASAGNSDRDFSSIIELYESNRPEPGKISD